MSTGGMLPDPTMDMKATSSITIMPNAEPLPKWLPEPKPEPEPDPLKSKVGRSIITSASSTRAGFSVGSNVLICMFTAIHHFSVVGVWSNLASILKHENTGSGRGVYLRILDLSRESHGRQHVGRKSALRVHQHRHAPHDVHHSWRMGVDGLRPDCLRSTIVDGAIRPCESNRATVHHEGVFPRLNLELGSIRRVLNRAFAGGDHFITKASSGVEDRIVTALPGGRAAGWFRLGRLDVIFLVDRARQFSVSLSDIGVNCPDPVVCAWKAISVVAQTARLM